MKKIDLEIFILAVKFSLFLRWFVFLIKKTTNSGSTRWLQVLTTGVDLSSYSEVKSTSDVNVSANRAVAIYTVTN